MLLSDEEKDVFMLKGKYKFSGWMGGGDINLVV